MKAKFRTTCVNIGNSKIPLLLLIALVATGGLACSDKSNDPSPPAAPELIAPASGAVAQPTDITLFWTSSSAQNFRLFLDDKNPHDVPSIAVDGSTSYKVQFLSQSRTYYWSVAAVDARGTQSEPSPTWQFTTGSFSYGWSDLAAMPTERLGAASAVVDGKLYVLGGTSLSGFSRAVESYDPATNSWTTHSPLSSNRSYACAVAIQGKIHLFGGLSSNVPQALHEVYDPLSDSWETKAPMPSPRSRFAADVLNGKIYVFGGSEGELDIVAYNVASDAWQKVGELPRRRDGLSATNYNGLFYLIGGSEPENFWLTDLSTFDPTSGQITKRASMPTARRDHRASLVGDKIYVTGGLNAVTVHVFFASVEVYDPSADRWITRSRMKLPRHDHSTGVIGDKIYTAGGLTEHEPNIINSLEVYDPHLDP